MERHSIKRPKKHIKELFNKKFYFKKSKDWILPEPGELFDTLPYEFESLQGVKLELNKVKSQLNEFNLNEWHDHTSNRSLGKCIVYEMKKTRAELVTLAFCKFFEILKQFRIVKGPVSNSIHLCEAPGAFVASLNYFLHLNFQPDDVCFPLYETFFV